MDLAVSDLLWYLLWVCLYVQNQRREGGIPQNMKTKSMKNDAAKISWNVIETFYFFVLGVGQANWHNIPAFANYFCARLNEHFDKPWRHPTHWSSHQRRRIYPKRFIHRWRMKRHVHLSWKEKRRESTMCHMQIYGEFVPCILLVASIWMF